MTRHEIVSDTYIHEGDVDDDYIANAMVVGRRRHRYCLQPPLKVVPKGDFFCPYCKAKQKVEFEKVRFAGKTTGVFILPVGLLGRACRDMLQDLLTGFSYVLHT